MSSHPFPSPAASRARSLRRARLGASLLFFTNGAIIANLAPRLPELKAALGLGGGAYGMAVAASTVGAILVGPFAARLLRRIGSARMATAGTVFAGLAILLVGFSPALPGLLAPGLFVFGLLASGAMDALTDVAENSQGLQVQRRYGKSIVGSMHAVWSVGAVTGGLMAAGALAWGLPLPVHFAASALLVGTVALLAFRLCLPPERTRTVVTDGVWAPGSDPAPEQGHRTGEYRREGAGTRVLPVWVLVLALGVLGVAGAGVEDLGSTWSGVYLGTLGASAQLAAWGFTVIAGSQFIGRLLGDPLGDRLGPRAVTGVGGLLVCVGMGLALTLPGLPLTFAGYALAGLGVGTCIPNVLARADELSGLKPGTGLALVSWLMRLGSLCLAPVVGFISDHAATGLRAGLVCVPVAGLLIVLLCWVLPGRRGERL
jgi:MFS family permease